MKVVREAEWAASGNTEFPIPGAVQAEIGETIYWRFQNWDIGIALSGLEAFFATNYIIIFFSLVLRGSLSAEWNYALNIKIEVKEQTKNIQIGDK